MQLSQRSPIELSEDRCRLTVFVSGAVASQQALWSCGFGA